MKWWGRLCCTPPTEPHFVFAKGECDQRYPEVRSVGYSFLFVNPILD